MERADVVVVGGGIVGLATARAILRADPSRSVVVVEKEATVGAHQSGRNSGVIHAGVYYQPGSEKARLCTAGRLSMVRVLPGARDRPRGVRQGRGRGRRGRPRPARRARAAVRGERRAHRADRTGAAARARAARRRRRRAARARHRHRRLRRRVPDRSPKEIEAAGARLHLGSTRARRPRDADGHRASRRPTARSRRGASSRAPGCTPTRSRAR